MKLSVIGCGYLGAVHAACMADLGHDVVGVEVVPEKVEKLTRGEAPFFEAGLPDLLRSGLDAGRLRFTPDVAEVTGSTVHFICVGTPQRQGEMGADLSYVWAAVESLLPHLSAGDVVVGKSTVPVGTAERVAEQVAEVGATLVWNPEFLREGKAHPRPLTGAPMHARPLGAFLDRRTARRFGRRRTVRGARSCP